MLRFTLVATAVMATVAQLTNGVRNETLADAEGRNDLLAYRAQVEFYGPTIPCFTSDNAAEEASSEGGRRMQDINKDNLSAGDDNVTPERQGTNFDDNRFATVQRPSVLVLTSGICQVTPDSPANSYQVNCNANGDGGQVYFCADNACQNCQQPTSFTDGTCTAIDNAITGFGSANVWKVTCFNPYREQPGVEQCSGDACDTAEDSGAGAATVAVAAITAAGAAAYAAM